MENRKKKDLSQFALLALMALAVNIIAQYFFFRLDLTAEKRFSLNPATKALLEKADEPILVRVYLEGDFPAGFRRLQQETKQMLDEFRAYNKNVEYIFDNPNAVEDPGERKEILTQLRSKGLVSFRVQVEEAGKKEELEIFPGAIVSYKGKEATLQLLQAQLGQSPESQINASVENLEFTLANTLRALLTENKPIVAFLEGHGELDKNRTQDLAASLADHYVISRFNLRQFPIDSTSGEPSIAKQLTRMNRFNAIIIAKPTQPFTDLDKWLLDQYIMNGGKTLWFVDPVFAEMDSLSKAPAMLAFPQLDQLRIGDQLFRYGVRLNTGLVQDMVCAGVSDMRSINPWVYFPLLVPQTKHPVVKGLNAIKAEFATTLDTIIAPGVKKTVLLRTSPYTKISATPAMVNLQSLYEKPEESTFNTGYLPVAMMLEGTFTSAFKNRIAPQDNNGQPLPFREEGTSTSMLVMADGDVVKNQLNLVNPAIPRGTPLPLGYDQFTGMTYGNKNFVLNAIDYMLDETGLIEIRSRELTLRMLDAQRIQRERNYWMLLNTLLPLLVVILSGFVWFKIRRMRYAK